MGQNQNKKDNKATINTLMYVMACVYALHFLLHIFMLNSLSLYYVTNNISALDARGHCSQYRKPYNINIGFTTDIHSRTCVQQLYFEALITNHLPNYFVCVQSIIHAQDIQGLYSLRRQHLIDKGIPIINLRWSSDGFAL